ncbi:hypothetical protein D9M69_732380 [compost metagenome]
MNFVAAACPFSVPGFGVEGIDIDSARAFGGQSLFINGILINDYNETEATFTNFNFFVRPVW